MTYRGLILDFVGVLTADVTDVIGAWCVREGLPPQAWHEALTVDPEGRERYLALEAGRLTQAEWNRHTAVQLGLADADNLMGRVWADVRRADDMIALAVAARAAGMKVAMLSNSFGLDPYDPYAHAGVWDLFDVAVISEREGVAKPDPAIYQLTLDRMQLTGADCVFVDDQPVNLPPAAALGITTVHADGDPGYVGRLAALLGLSPAPGTPRAV
ncbi:HAD-IA family hydrolase [Streptomyces sp. MS19]|uniref:HAD-IA family hydrolase n=1 Tax=Streptomyces sp. MS19 TaxID=3385972 RepID=UPI0039A02FD3